MSSAITSSDNNSGNVIDNVGTVPDAEQLCQRQAIQDILTIHSRGLDRGESELLKRAYWPEAEVDYGAFKGSAHQFAELIGPALESQYELTQHSLGQSVICLAGDRAKSESYVTARHLLAGAKEEMIFVGRYLDQFEHRDGRWKIMHRQVVMDWSRSAVVVDERSSDAFAALAKGSKAEQDPTFSFFK